MDMGWGRVNVGWWSVGWWSVGVEECGVVECGVGECDVGGGVVWMCGGQSVQGEDVYIINSLPGLGFDGEVSPQT